MNLKQVSFFSMILVTSLAQAEPKPTTPSSTPPASSSPLTADQVRSIVREEIERSIGFIDPMRIYETQEMKDSFKLVEKTLEDKKQEIMAVEKKGMQKKQAFEQMAAALDEKAREQRIEELAKLDAEYQTKTRAAQEYARVAEERLRMQGLKRMQESVTELAEKEGYSMVLAGGVVYGGKPNDLTEKVVTNMEQKYKAQQKETVVADAQPAKKSALPAAPATSKNTATA